MGIIPESNSKKSDKNATFENSKVTKSDFSVIFWGAMKAVTKVDLKRLAIYGLEVLVLKVFLK